MTLEIDVKKEVDSVLGMFPELKTLLTDSEMELIVKHANEIIKVITPKVEKMPDDLVSHLLAGLGVKFRCQTLQ